MLDLRVHQLAEMLCSHSVSLGPEDCVLIHAIDIPEEAVAAMVEAAHAAGAQAFVKTESSRVQRSLMRGMTLRNAETMAEIDLHEMKRMTAYIAFRGAANAFEGADVDGETRAMWAKAYSAPVHGEQRVNHTKWAVLRWPSPGMAQQAGMSTEAFEDFYFQVCNVDYGRMEAAARPLVELMSRTDRVEIKGPGTDLSFSIQGIGAVSCHGRRNIPDGECFSAPVAGSMNGTVQYNTVSLYEGREFKDIRFTVRNGEIADAEAGAMTERLNHILDTDPGARRFGEWSLGYNPAILHPMRDTLFDEKIAGSFHLTPGRSYAPPGGNGNESAIHWDIVCIQRPDYGGGEVWFDGVLIRKDGLFVIPELAGLNPDALAS
jgi:aminopeptidase